MSAKRILCNNRKSTRQKALQQSSSQAAAIFSTCPVKVWRRARCWPSDAAPRSNDPATRFLWFFYRKNFVSSKIVFDQKFSRIIVDSQSARRCHLMASSLMHSTLMVFVFACASLTDKPHLSVSAQFFFFFDWSILRQVGGTCLLNGRIPPTLRSEYEQQRLYASPSTFFSVRFSYYEQVCECVSVCSMIIVARSYWTWSAAMGNEHWTANIVFGAAAMNENHFPAEGKKNCIFRFLKRKNCFMIFWTTVGRFWIPFKVYSPQSKECSHH